jgi:adenylate cyclase
MVVPTLQRRLAAILAADVVGYTRLMGADEAGTHVRLRALRKGFIEPKVAEHRGRFVKLTGDGALVEFASVIDAVRCAVEIQQGITERSMAEAESQRIELRIGINLGDVIFDEDDIYGDGVNVAARLEGLAEPGGVCISDFAHHMVRTEIDLAFEDLGEQRVKNIDAPIRVWHWGAGASSSKKAASDTGRAIAPPVQDKPSIAVLPFDNMARDPDQEYFSDGLTEDLITDLSQVSGLFVTSRYSVFQYKNHATKPQRVAKDLGVRYVLEGSVRRAASRVRINAQLIDAATGYHLWAERYDGGLEDIFALQDEITHAIVSALEVRLTSSDRESIARRYTDNMEAYDLFLRARESHLMRRSKQGAEEARLALERAIELDPNFAAAFAVLGETYRQEWRFEWCDDEDLLDRALASAREAVRLDEELPLAHMLLGWICLWRREFDQAIEAAERSVELDPCNAEALIRLGHILEFSSRPTEGLPLIERAMALDPHHPFIYPFWLGHALQGLQRHEDAIGAKLAAYSTTNSMPLART